MENLPKSNTLLDWFYQHRKTIAVILICIMVLSVILDSLMARQDARVVAVHQQKLVREEVQRVATLNSHIEDINDHLSSFLSAVENSNYTEALDKITYVIENDEPIADYYLKRGGVYVLLEDYTSAMDDLNKSLELDDSQTDVYSLMGQIHLIEENYSEAITVFQQAIALSPSAETYYNLALCYMLTEQYAQAKTHLTNALANDCSKELKATCEELLSVLNEANIF